jgi:hypothetical protein
MSHDDTLDPSDDVETGGAEIADESLDEMPEDLPADEADLGPDMGDDDEQA